MKGRYIVRVVHADNMSPRSKAELLEAVRREGPEAFAKRLAELLAVEDDPPRVVS